MSEKGGTREKDFVGTELKYAMHALALGGGSPLPPSWKRCGRTRRRGGREEEEDFVRKWSDRGGERMKNKAAPARGMKEKGPALKSQMLKEKRSKAEAAPARGMAEKCLMTMFRASTACACMGRRTSAWRAAVTSCRMQACMMGGAGPVAAWGARRAGGRPKQGVQPCRRPPGKKGTAALQEATGLHLHNVLPHILKKGGEKRTNHSFEKHQTSRPPGRCPARAPSRSRPPPSSPLPGGRAPPRRGSRPPAQRAHRAQHAHNGQHAQHAHAQRAQHAQHMQGAQGAPLPDSEAASSMDGPANGANALCHRALICRRVAPSARHTTLSQLGHF